MGVPYVPPHIIYGSNHLLRDDKTTPMEVMSAWKKQYGDVFGYFVGNKATLVITDLDMVKQILIKDFQNFVNRPKLSIEAEPVMSTLVGLRDQRWKDVRSLLTPTFSMAKMKLMADTMNDKVNTLLGIIQQHVDKNEAVEWYSTYQGLTLDTICACALAMKSSCQTNQSDELLQSVRGFLNNALNSFIKLALYFSVFGKIISFVSNNLSYSGRMTSMIVSHLKKIIKIRRKEKNTKILDVLQLMLNASDDSKREEPESEANRVQTKMTILSDKEIIANAWVFLLGGFETTANALTFTSFLLAKHKLCQDRAYEEVKSIIKVSSYWIVTICHNVERLG